MSSNGKPKAKSKATSARCRADVAKRVAAIRLLAPTTIDGDAIRLLVGDVQLRTLAEVADVFDVERNTVQTSWRQAGCPGSSGRYDVAEILAWLLRRDQKRAKGSRGANGYSNGHAGNEEERNELAQLEIEAARANLQIRQARAARLSADVLPIAVARSCLGSVLSAARDKIMRIPLRIGIEMPKAHAANAIAIADRECRSALTMIGETPLEELLERHNNEQR